MAKEPLNTSVTSVAAHRSLSARHVSHLRRLFLLLALLAALGVGIAVLAQAPVGAVGVYYVGREDAIAETINLAAPYIVRVDQPELAQVLIVNDFLPRDEETVRLYRNQVQQGDVGLVIFCGSQFPESVEDLSQLLGVSAFGMANIDQRLSVQAGSEDDALHQAIAWNSAPQIQSRTVISNPNLLLPVITTSTREPVIQRVRGREGAQVFIVGGWLNAPVNVEWQNWPYFRYMIYWLIMQAADAPRTLAFADYPLSPVPQGQLRLALIAGGTALLFLTGWAIYLTRRYLFLHPEAGTNARATPTAPQTLRVWNTVGFHRPLAGFFALATPYFLLFFLLLIYRIDILPHDLIPWSQPLQFWEMTARWFDVVWLLFDIGTGIAAVYHFVTLYNRRPGDAFRHFQVYVWWQLISGAIQVGGIVIFTTVVLPGTTLAHLAFYAIAHTLIQFPGFFQVFRLFFRAIQRLDYEQYLTFIVTMGPVALQGSAIVFMRRWGSARPMIGEALGGVLGLGIGLYLTEGIAFIVGMLLYRRLGYALRTLWLPAFDWHTIERVMGFGAKLTFGAAFVPLSALVQTALIPRWIPDFSAVRDGWTLALLFAAAYDVIGLGLYNGLMPALVEAYLYKYKTLLRFYISQGLHYGMWFSLFILAVLSAVGARVAQGLFGSAYAGAAPWIIPVLGWGAIQWPVWTANQVLIAMNRPAVTSWLTIGEQGLRLGLMVALVPALGLRGLVIAFTAATLVRAVTAWLIIQRAIGRPHIYIWRTLIAPAGAAVIIHTLLRVAGERWGAPTLSAGVTLALVALFPALALYGLLTALFGGWDDGSLDELRRAMRISGVGLPLAWLLTQAVRLGAISPLHGRFPIGLRSLAEEEAQALAVGRAPRE